MTTHHDCPTCYGDPRGECPDCGAQQIDQSGVRFAEWDSVARRFVWPNEAV
jgi:hypothetical protein